MDLDRLDHPHDAQPGRSMEHADGGQPGTSMEHPDQAQPGPSNHLDHPDPHEDQLASASNEEVDVSGPAAWVEAVEGIPEEGLGGQVDT